MPYQAINPYSGELIREFPDATTEQVEQALVNAQQFYQSAKKQPIAERAHLLQQLATEFRQQVAQYARPMTTNMGKLWAEAQAEVGKTADFAEYYVKNGERLLQDTAYPDVPKGKAHVEYHSIGAIMTIEPWNFPFTQIMRVFAPNFIVGNPVLLKDPSIIPECAQAFEDATRKVGLPVGAFKNLFASYDQVNQIIADDRVQGVAFTGSDGAGKKIAATAGENLCKSTMELGGTDVFIVLDDADLASAIAAGVAGRLNNAGQVCTAAKRFMIHESVYADFVAGMSAAFAQRKLGDPLDSATTLAPLSSKAAQEQLQKQVAAIIKGGAKLIWGKNEPIAGPGALFNPLILEGMDFDHPMYDTELFGPVAQIYKIKNDAEALELANQSRRGLGGSIFSGNLARARKLASQIETGQVAINQMLTSYPELPFGGVKHSGYGRELSDLGLREFVNAKTIIE
ncbi:NAD-dependent succinate-semialdehyde dehydrogenase [Loigolactobacillus zhaoyuanensis]|uniref:NAD-dependent succinate-semialdehyde dehydrogenase n=1 Tax=Loigolactobacillus zhaoyuanensis TaxID=2486017 RepID=UPI000F746C57|nr:NAD-dependent succinate-semialdehyde dehydrogenase [Loigolactobacillus zhaoyuanensis]